MLKTNPPAIFILWSLAVAASGPQRPRVPLVTGGTGREQPGKQIRAALSLPDTRSPAITSNQRGADGAAPKAGADCAAVPKGSSSKEHASETTGLLISVDRCDHF